MPSATVHREIPTVPPPGPPPEPDSQVSEPRGPGVHAEGLRIRAFWSEIGRTPECLACETPRSGEVSHSRMQSASGMPGRSRQTAAAEEAKRGVVEEPDSRPLNPSASSTDPMPKNLKTTTADDPENTPDRMDVDSFQRTPATSHPLEPVSDENLSKKARVAGNVLHIRGESELKFDINEEAWPNAELSIRSSYEGGLIDGLRADKVKAGDEREIQQMKDLQLYS